MKKEANKPLMMTSDLLPSYPTGEYLEGNFIEAYLNGFTYYDRYIVKLFGERGIEVDKLTPISDVAIEWTYDINAIVFTHLTEWAKLYSANIKDYEPLWNVDGTEETTYGATKRTEDIKQRQDTDLYGAREENTDYGARHTEDFNPTHTDTSKNYNTAYPDGNSAEVSKSTDEYGAFTAEHDEDRALDTFTTDEYQDTHTIGAHKDIFEEDEHKDTLRRTGNIGVTSSMNLVEQEFSLRSKWIFFKMIFSLILKEEGVHYYD